MSYKALKRKETLVSDLRTLMKKGRHEEAKNVILELGNEIGKIFSYRERIDNGESMVMTVIHNNPPQELIDMTTDIFMKLSGENQTTIGYWGHALSHFTNELWEMGQIDVLKKLLEFYFAKGMEFYDPRYFDRLIQGFARFAQWDHKASDFHITDDVLTLIERSEDTEISEYAKERIKKSPFASEAEFIKWQLIQPRNQESFNFEAQTGLINIEKVKELIQKLTDLGEDTSEFDNFIPELLQKKLEELGKIETEGEPDWIKERKEKAIEITKKALEESQD